MNWRLSAFFIEKHRLFDAETTINLGGSFFYEIELQGSRDLFISRKKNESFVNDFFGDQVSLVSAIVGSNGAGKTSVILEVIKNPETILIFERGNESVLVKNQYRFSLDKQWWGIFLEPDEFENLIVKRKDVDAKSFERLIFDFNRLNSPNILYYNPLAHINPFISDENIVKFHFESAYELSQNILINNLRLISNTDLISEIRNVFPRFPNIAKANISSTGLVLEDLFEIELVLSGGNDGSERITRDELVNRFEKKVSSGKYQEKIYFLTRRRGSENLEPLLNVAIKLYVMSRLLVHVEERINSYFIDYEPYAKESVKLNYDVNDILRWLEKLNNLLPSRKTELFTTPSSFISKAIEWIKDYPNDEQLNFNQLESLVESKFFLRQEELEQLFINSKATDLTGKMDFKLAIVSPSYSLSQGEETLLNILSGFLSNKEFGVNRSQILFLDEATVGFHPRWQKKFVKAITELLPIIFKSKLLSVKGLGSKLPSQIQIIFSTHDPFSLSDLPRYNVVYLNSVNGLTKIVSNEDSLNNKKAFGANITDLLEDAFFIGDGDDALIGEFAQEKINGVIKWIELENEKREKYTNDYMLEEEGFEKQLSIIKLIDEHIIQLKLAEMLDELRNNNEIKRMIIKDQITGLQDKLNELPS